jgi:hypothetical protein
MADRAKAQGRWFITSGVLTSDASRAAIQPRDATKQARPPGRRPEGAQVLAELPHDPDPENYLVPRDDMTLFRAFAVVAARALQLDPADDLAAA